MSLRSDSVYRVDLRDLPSDHESGDEVSSDSRPQPKVLQIRLTEQSLLQLASASASPGAKIQIDVDSAEPLLIIDGITFPLHAPPVASGGTSRTGLDSSPASSSPHDLFKLSDDESTLRRVGTIATKFTVKPTRDVSAVAQRLKQQKEEEEQRKEERRKALMLGASPQLTASSSPRSGMNKSLASVKANNAIALSSSPLSRSSSLNKLSARREPIRPQASLHSRGVSRETSPDPHASSHIPPTRLQGASYEAVPGMRRLDRAATDSPQLTTTNRPRSLSRLDDADRGPTASSSGLRKELSHDEHSNKGPVNDAESNEDISPRRSALLSSPASAASDLSGGTAKKSSKLTTRQRLAKATKAGSRLLAASASERRATLERRTAPVASQISPPSKLRDSETTSAVDASRFLPVNGLQPPSRQDSDETSPIANKSRANPDPSTDSKAVNRARIPKDVDTDQASTTTSSSRRLTGEQPTASSGKQNDSKLRQETSKMTGKSVPSAERSDPTLKSRVVNISDAASGSDRNARPASKRDSPPVKVVTMKRSRPSTEEDASAKGNANTVAISRTGKRSDPRADVRDGPARPAGPSSDSTSSSSKKETTVRKATESLEDAGQRKRRRTNDFASSEDASQYSGPASSKSGDLRSHPSEASPNNKASTGHSDFYRRVQEHASPQSVRSRGELPQSASMPSFTAASARLQDVAEIPDRIAKRPAATEYKDRRRDRSYDEDYHEGPRGRRERPFRKEGDERRGLHKVEEEGKSSRELGSTSSPANAPSTSKERPIKGVGPGATHWSEPWLDVRSRSDWHRLAQRFAKTQEDYLATRRRLEAESQRLDREMELAAMEEQKLQAFNKSGEVPTEQSLLFSPHNAAHPSSASDTGSNHLRTGKTSPQAVEVQAARNTSMNSRSTTHSKADAADDGDDSPEEGEMRSSDEEETGADTTKFSNSDQRSSGGRSPSTFDSLLRDTSRSESPDNITWRPSSAIGSQGTPRDHVSSDAADRPLTYSDLASQVQKLSELHGSLSRMHRVLVDFKAKGVAASAK